MDAGIYFGLPEAEYHADPALSSSGIRNLLVSPLDYWMNSTMNPEYVDEKTDAMVIGTALHRRILEPARFRAMYAAVPTKDEYPDALDGAEALRARCAELGLKRSGTISDMCERILEVDPRAELWPVIRAEMMEKAQGRIMLRPSVAADIERAAWIVLKHQSAAKAMSGGHAEVSIFWTDPETGIAMKARLDYLKVKAVVDLKSFSNPLGKPLKSAVAAAVANGGYHIQAVVYSHAVEAAKQMLRKHKSKCVRVLDDSDVSAEWLVNFAACERHAFAFVFIETGPVTNVVVREFRRVENFGGTENLYWSAGEAGMRQALSIYQRYMTEIGPNEPWIADAPMTPFIDVDFPLWMMS